MELRFTRNRIRHDLLPRLRSEFNADVDAALLRLGHLAGESQSVIDELVERMFVGAVQLNDQNVAIHTPALVHQPRYLVRELLVRTWQRKNWPQQAMGYAEWDALAKMLQKSGDTTRRQRTLPGNIRATKKGEQLTLTRL